MVKKSKAEVWFILQIWGPRASNKLLIKAAKKSGLNYKIKRAQYFTWVGKILFYKGIPVKKSSMPKIIVSRSESKRIRKIISHNPDIIAINKNETYEIADNKYNCHVRLEEHNILQPKFSKPTKQSTYKDTSEELGEKFIVKDVLGFRGSKVFLVESEKEYKRAIRKCGIRRAMCQEFITTSHGKDIRVIIMGGKIIVAFTRQGKGDDFRANLSQGGTAEFVKLTEEQEKHAIKVYNALGGGFLSVDFLFGVNDELIFCESNVHTALRMLYDHKTHNIDVARSLMDYVKENIAPVDVDEI